VKQVIDDTYLSKLDSKKSLEECNEEYLQNHKSSAPHVHSVVRFRAVLKPGAQETREKGVKDLLETLKLEGITLQQAVDGLEVLSEIGAEREEYVRLANQRWPEANAFVSGKQ
jgi:N-alpha-acetyltransferase 15/16, NatA auxiliary subunit